MKGRRDDIERPNTFGIQTVIQHLQDKDMLRDLSVYRVANESLYHDYILCATCISSRQMVAMANEVLSLGKEYGIVDPRTMGVTKADREHWTMVEVGWLVVHFFSEEGRKLHDVETQWRHARVPSDQLSSLQDVDHSPNAPLIHVTELGDRPENQHQYDDGYQPGPKTGSRGVISPKKRRQYLEDELQRQLDIDEVREQSQLQQGTSAAPTNTIVDAASSSSPRTTIEGRLVGLQRKLKK